MQIEADVPAATATVKDVRPSPRKYTKKDKQQPADIAQGGLATPPSGNRRKMKMEFKKEDQEVLQDPNPIEFLATASGKRGRTRSPSTNRSNKRPSK